MLRFSQRTVGEQPVKINLKGVISMARIKNNDLVGYFIGQGHVCRDCATSGEEEEATLDNLIIKRGCLNDDRYFCDRCQKEI